MRRLTPEIAPDLHLPEQDSVLALDTFHSAPELVPLAQSDGQLNRNTAHNVLFGMVNPMSSPHTIVTLKGMRAVVQVHVPDPVFYVRVGDDTDTPGERECPHGRQRTVPRATPPRQARAVRRPAGT